MATLNFPDAPDTGDIYTDSNSGFTYEWNGTVWISKDPSTASNIREINDISGDFNGSTTAFTLKVAGVNVVPANVQQLIISVGGVMQNAGDDYTVSGSTLTFTTPPTSGLTFFGTLLGTALSLNTVADGSVGSSSLKTEDYTIGGSGNTVTIPGNLTVQGTETIINTNELNVQDKTIGIGSTNAPTSASQDGAGAIIYGQTHVNILYDVDKAALGINTGVSVAGFITATGLRSLGVTTCGAGLSLADSVKAKFGDSGDLEIFHNGSHSIIADVGTGNLQLRAADFRVTDSTNAEVMIKADTNGAVELRYDNVKRFETADGGVVITGVSTADGLVGGGVTINNTGIDAGIGAGIITAKTYFGDATNMTGAGSTFQALSFDPFKGKRLIQAQLSDNIAMTFNHGIEAGNAAKELTLRKDSPTGEIVQSFGVGSSVTYSAGQAIINPTDAFINENEYFVVIPEGAFKKIGTASSSPLINGYSFLTANFTRKTFTIGNNDAGMLAQNDRTTRSSPTQVGATPTFDYATINVFYGYKGIILARDLDTGGNTAWAIGGFADGQSGLNAETGTFSSPTQIGTNINWRSVTFGDRHLVASKTDNTLWTWGKNQDGSIGSGSANVSQSSPLQIGTDTDWSDQVYANSAGSGCIKTDGTLWMWGQNQAGCLGLNQGTTHYSSPKQVGTDTTWKYIAKGGSNLKFCMAIKTDGSLWGWGNQNSSGSLGLNQEAGQYSSPTQVGTDTTWHSISASAADENACCMALKTDGTLWTWGGNKDGCLGLSNGNKRSSPTQVGTETTWGNGKYDNISNYGDYSHTMRPNQAGCIKTDGTLWTWGKNGEGNLGHNNRSDKNSPTQVGTSESWGGLAMGGLHQEKLVTYFFEKAKT